MVDHLKWKSAATVPSKVIHLASDDYSDDELAAMHVISMYKPVARAEYFEYLGLGNYDSQAPILKSLASKGLVKVNSTGAISLDKGKAKKIMGERTVPKKYKGKLENSTLNFKSSDE